MWASYFFWCYVCWTWNLWYFPDDGIIAFILLICCHRCGGNFISYVFIFKYITFFFVSIQCLHKYYSLLAIDCIKVNHVLTASSASDSTCPKLLLFSKKTPDRLRFIPQDTIPMLIRRFLILIVCYDSLFWQFFIPTVSYLSRFLFGLLFILTFSLEFSLPYHKPPFQLRPASPGMNRTEYR